MLIFISGSVNSGKSTTAKLLAEKLGAEFLDFDDVSNSIPDFDLNKDLPQVFEKGIKVINRLAQEGKSVVANYVLQQADYELLKDKVQINEQHYITLAPRLEVARSNRGRGLSDWEFKRIKHHYDTGIATPSFGETIDNSDISPEEAVAQILKLIKK